MFLLLILLLTKPSFTQTIIGVITVILEIIMYLNVMLLFIARHAKSNITLIVVLFTFPKLLEMMNFITLLIMMIDQRKLSSSSKSGKRTLTPCLLIPLRKKLQRYP